MASLAESGVVHSVHFTDRMHQAGHNRVLMELRKNSQMTDVVLQAGDVAVPCHKLTLVGSSQYFHTLFVSGDNPDIVKLDDVHPDILETLVEFFYTSHIEISTQNVLPLIQVCDKFDMDGVKEECGRFLEKYGETMIPLHFLSVFRAAKLLDLKSLQKNMLQHFKANFNGLVQSLSKSELELFEKDEVVECVMEDELNTDEEETVLHFVLRWLEVDPQKRRTAIQEIFKHTRLPFCSLQGLTIMQKTLKKTGVASDLFQEYLDGALWYNAHPEHRHEMVNCRTRPRKQYEQRCLVIIGGIDEEDGDIKICSQLGEDGKTWNKMPDIPNNVRLLSACLLQNGILITGGYRGVNAVSETCFFNMSSMKWEAMSQLKEARARHASVSCGGCVYVIGGKASDDKTVLNTVEKLTVKADEWVSVSPMRKHLSHPLTVAFHNNLFVFGGRDESDGHSTSVCVYNTVCDTWSSLADMPQMCRLGSAVIINDMIFAVGGYNKCCMAYSIPGDSWSVLTPPQIPHGNAPAVVWRGNILVAGGYNGGDTQAPISTVIEEYNPDTDTWSTWDVAMPAKLTSHCMLNVHKG